MTCVVGILEPNGSIYLGGDSASCLNDFVEIRKDPKVFIRDKFIFGCSGDCKTVDIFKYKFETPKHPKDMDTVTYMKTLFVDAIEFCFKKYDAVLLKEDIKNIYDFTCLVGYQGHLFMINNNLYVSETNDGYMALGSNELALGSLYSTKKVCEYNPKNYNVKECIQLALEASAYFNNTVKEPFTILKL